MIINFRIKQEEYSRLHENFLLSLSLAVVICNHIHWEFICFPSAINNRIYLQNIFSPSDAHECMRYFCKHKHLTGKRKKFRSLYLSSCCFCGCSFFFCWFISTYRERNCWIALRQNQAQDNLIVCNSNF